MSLYEKILKRKEKIAVIGLGYVGLPIAYSFAKKVDVIGFDLNENRISEYRAGKDSTHEIGDGDLISTRVKFTSCEKCLKKARFFIVAVPTPVNADHTPDLSSVIKASEIIGRNLSKKSLVVYVFKHLELYHEEWRKVSDLGGVFG